MHTLIQRPQDCHREVVDNLKTLLATRHKILAQELPKSENGHPREEQFVAEMNALVVKDAEEYYRTMMTEDVRSWNLRFVGSARLTPRRSDGVSMLQGQSFCTDGLCHKPILGL